MTKMIDWLLAIAFKENRAASTDSLKKVLEKGGFKNLPPDKKTEVFDILGTASLALLRLKDASQHFMQSGNKGRLKSVFELAVRHGKYRLVKELISFGKDKGIKELQLEPRPYLEFLKEKALPYLALCRDEQAGFSIDEQDMSAILEEIGETKEKVLAETVQMMENAGSLNLVKKFILAYYSGDAPLIKRYEDKFNSMVSGGRTHILLELEKYCGAKGLKLVNTLQRGDHDNYFPSVAHIFLVEKNGKPLVFKENVRLHQDYSRLSGYSMEKEILEIVRHKNIVRYLGGVEIEGHEFMIMRFMPGVTLEKYIRADNLLPLSKVLGIIKTLAQVIDYLHENKIISMDIKDKNAMYDGLDITLFDFGVSQIVRQKEFNDETFITSLLTTPEYVAPEMALTFKAYPKTDIFQLGILFYKLLVGKNPFVRYDIADFVEGDEYRESEIIKFVLPAIFREMDENPKILKDNPKLAALLRAMLRKDFKERPNAKGVLSVLENIN